MNLKVRAWDKVGKIMSEGMPFEWFITGNDQDMEFKSNDTSLPLSDLRFYISDYIFLAYTGINDKNGREIYQGDILKSEGHKKKSDLGHVVFDDGGFIIVVKGGKDWLDILGDKTEVVGNIYENAEMLQ